LNRAYYSLFGVGVHAGLDVGVGRLQCNVLPHLLYHLQRVVVIGFVVRVD